MGINSSDLGTNISGHVRLFTHCGTTAHTFWALGPGTATKQIKKIEVISLKKCL